jgi:hypothetical protein
VKQPLLNEKHCTAAFIAAIVLGVACLAAQWLFALPGAEYATAVFLLGITVLLVLFAGESTRATTQMVVMTFVVGTGIVLMAKRYEGLMNGITFGPSLLPVNDQLGALSGLLWLIPVVTSLRLAEQFTGNIYMRSLLGALLVLAPSLFMLLAADSQFLFFWNENAVSLKAVLLWFVGGFFFHFAANQLGVQKSNPVATRLYFVYLGFFAAAWILKLLFFTVS